jgi:HlyD family secretion protein
VVTYDVVINVANPELLLMPGMTANLSIVESRRDNVLRVPLRALAFSPRRHSSDSSTEAASSEHSARVWVFDGGHLRPVKIVRGLDDGSNVEVISGSLNEGDEVVTDRIRTSDEEASGHPFGAPQSLHLHM